MRATGFMPHRGVRLVLAVLLLLPALPIGAGPDPKGAPAAARRGALVDLKSGGKPLQGYLAKPAGKGPFPGVVIVFEWWGLNDQIKGVADRLAAEGYVALIPDLYHGSATDDPEKAHVLVRGLEESEVLSELGSAVSYLKALPEVGSARIGSLGFCVGGGFALQLALSRPDLSGAVMFYGSPETDPAVLKKASCPVLGLFGEEDQGIPADRINAMAKGLKEFGKGAEVKVYPGAGHAFFNEKRPSYNAEAAADAWKRTLAFFKTNLKG